MSEKNILVKEWTRKAESDLGIAQLALDHNTFFTDAICLNAQQCAEKYLKAYLVSQNLPFKKTHSLAYLLDLINEILHIPENIFQAAEYLESYAVKVRHSDDWFEPSAVDAKEAVALATAIKSFITSKID